MKMKCLIIAIIQILAAVVQGDYLCGTVYMTNGNPTFKAGVMDKAGAAYGFYNNTLNGNGWGVLEIKAAGNIPDSDLMYAAGYLEGILTSKQIWQQYTNLADWFSKANPNLLNKSREFFDAQEEWARKMINSDQTSSQFWRHASFIMNQYEGLIAGYQLQAQKPLPRYAFQLLNGAGDLLDLRNVFNPSLVPNVKHMRTDELRSWVNKNSLCSALVKVLPGFEDVFMSHSSWFIYQATLRIYKHYNFQVKNSGTAAKRISFSSYPGFLESLDDFYIMDSKLVMLQTTNNVFNKDLYKQVVPQSMLAWQRVRIANMLSHSGAEWAQALREYNSGTYNNQYMIIDLTRFHPKQRIDDSALWVVEQIPGLVEAADATDVLRAGYWPSYNVPFFEKIYNSSGYPSVVEHHGVEFSYQLAPRAEIFRRDQAGVTNFSDMKAIMRYNDYKEDKYSAGDSCKAICCRGDLRSSESGPNGCYDTKVTSMSKALKMESEAINGPTRSHGLPAFQWTDRFTASHIGLPQIYDFDFVTMKPTL